MRSAASASPPHDRLLSPVLRSTSMISAERIQQIAFAFPRGSHQEVFIEGVFRYANEHNLRWSYVMAPEWNAVSIRQLVGWPGDGVLAALNTPKEAAFAAEFHLPVVNISGAMPKSPVPRSMVDNVAVGVLAAEHLLERGFKSYAFYGMPDIDYSHRRLQGFSKRLAAEGFKPVVFTLPSTFAIRGNTWLSQQQQLTTWIEGLSKPCAVFAVSDARARQVINACQQVSVRVPEHVAVMGVDDQQVICDHVHPTITSIARNNILEGYAAAAILDRLMRGGKSPRSDRLIAPLSVVPRESTSTVAVTDERLREALTYFQQHIADPVTVEELCSHVDVSRRWLECSFRSELKATPHEYMQRERLIQARRLLADEPTTRVYRIAQRVGILSAKHFAKAFRREFGMSPREFRATMRM